MDIAAVDLVVTGRVQGVFFRAGMRDRAEELGVDGWVRNEADGSVRAHLEGPPDALDRLVDWCSEGSPEAVVDDVQRHDSEVTGSRGFRSV